MQGGGNTRVRLGRDETRTFFPVAAAVSRVGADGEAAVVARLGARATVTVARDRAGDSHGGRIGRVEVGRPGEAVHDVRARGVRGRGGPRDDEEEEGGGGAGDGRGGHGVAVAAETLSGADAGGEEWNEGASVVAMEHFLRQKIQLFLFALATGVPDSWNIGSTLSLGPDIQHLGQTQD